MQRHDVTVTYDGIVLGEYCVDLLVAQMLLVELKTVKALDKTHRAQWVSGSQSNRPAISPVAKFRKPTPRNQASSQPPMIRTAPSACIRVHLLLICDKTIFLLICKFARSLPGECQRTKRTRSEHDRDWLRDRIDQPCGAAISLVTPCRKPVPATRILREWRTHRSAARVLACVLPVLRHLRITHSIS